MLKLIELQDGKIITDRLRESGLSPENAEIIGVLAGKAARTLSTQGGVDGAVHVFWIPGRIEVMGKHTDYAGGHSLLAATEQGFLVVAAPRQDATVRIFALDVDEQAQFELSPNLTPTMGDWRNYPKTVVRRLARNFPSLFRGSDIAFASTIPIAAGMSSSSALMIGIYQALAAVNGLAESEPYQANIHTQEQLAEYLGTVENGQTYGTLAGDRGVGTFGGSEDHTGILCCKPGQLSRYRYCPTHYVDTLMLPDGYTFAVAASGVIADKTGSARDKYNRASALAAEVTAVWNRATGHNDAHMAAMLERCQGDPEPILAVIEASSSKRFAAAELRQRFLHFYSENEKLIPAAAEALAAGDVPAFAAAANASQEDGVRLLGNQIDETEALASMALQHGAVAASAFGAGFGGSVWALVRSDEIEPFLALWTTSYIERFPQYESTARFFQTRPGSSVLAL